jgi:hypothetical protein
MQSLIKKKKKNYTSFLDYKIITAVLNIWREYDTKRLSWRLRSPGMWWCVTGCAVPVLRRQHAPSTCQEVHTRHRNTAQMTWHSNTAVTGSNLNCNLHDWMCILEVKNCDIFCYQDFRKCMLAMLEGNMAVRVIVQKTNFWIKYYYIFNSSSPTYPEKASACFPNVLS